MNTQKEKVRALGLCSGGLDSMLAGLVLRGQGIEVEWVTFETPFFSAAKARKASRATGIPLTVRSIFPRYLAMLRNPPAGYGKYMNPCMDCHALMFRLAGEIMRERGFDFLFSGEVVGQRPMSQTKPSLRYVEKHSGLSGLILRPLSAKHLPATLPELSGLVDREKLLDICGRGRRDQIRLARELGVSEYPAPAGGCLLTDKGFSARLRDLFDHQVDCTESQVELLKYGRHFRLAPNAKLIVGRTEGDNENILRRHDGRTDVVLNLQDHPGPVGLIPGGADSQIILRAAAVCVGYSKAPKLTPVAVVVKQPAGEEVIQAIAVMPEDVRRLMI